jgi:hypothetical protein
VNLNFSVATVYIVNENIILYSGCCETYDTIRVERSVVGSRVGFLVENLVVMMGVDPEGSLQELVSDAFSTFATIVIEMPVASMNAIQVPHTDRLFVVAKPNLVAFSVATMVCNIASILSGGS